MEEKPKILIVDDRKENLVVLEKILASVGADFVKAYSGNEALAMTLKHDFALCLMDVQMPEMDGFETVELMRQEDETRLLPVIFISAIYKEDYHLQKGIEKGAVDFITKPIVSEVLRGKVQVFLDLYREKKRLQAEISLRKKTENFLAQINNFNEQLIATLPFGLDIVDDKGTVLFMNDIFKDMVAAGFSRRKCWQAYDDKNIENNQNPLKREIEIGKVTVVEIEGCDGSSKVMRITSIGMNYHNQKAVLEIFQDVTQEKRREKELFIFQKVAEVAGYGFGMSNTEGKIVYANKALQDMLGEEGVNQDVIKYYQDKDKVFLRNTVLPQVIENGTWTGEIPVMSVDGKITYTVQNIFIVPTADGASNFTNLLIDIGGRKKAEDMIKKANKELEEKNKELLKLDELKSEFVSTVSHELRTPLTTIRESVSQILEGILGPINDDQKEFLSIALSDTDRLKRIIDNLLDISKIESGKMNVLKHKVDLVPIAKRTLQSFSSYSKEKNILLKEVFPNAEIPVFVDADKIIQVFTNLIGNAFKFTNEGSITLEIVDNQDSVTCSIIDTGIGISKDDLGKVFGKFQQFGRTNGPGEKGTGLGLAISKSIVEMHDGNIWVESEIGKGTKFCFTLPKFKSQEDLCAKKINKEINILKEKKSKKKFSVILQMIDLKNVQSSLDEDDRFQIMNIIKDMVLEAATRPGDKIISCCSEKMLAFLPDTDTDGAKTVCARIVDVLSEKDVVYNNKKVEIESSFGMATFPKDGQDGHQLLKTAKESLTKKKKILIVDDHPQIVKLLTTCLEAEGIFECLQAFNGEEGLEKINENLPDLVICDVMMPKMNGYEVIGRVKENAKTKDIPIIVLTAFQTDSESVQSLIPGSVPVIGKSDGFDKVLSMVKKLI